MWRLTSSSKNRAQRARRLRKPDRGLLRKAFCCRRIWFSGRRCRNSSRSGAVNLSVRRPSSRSTPAFQLPMDCAEGLNSLENTSAVCPARISSIAARRTSDSHYSGDYPDVGHPLGSPPYENGSTPYLTRCHTAILASAATATASSNSFLFFSTASPLFATRSPNSNARFLIAA